MYSLDDEAASAFRSIVKEITATVNIMIDGFTYLK